MGRERELQPAAERSAVDRGDDRLCAGFDAVADLGQRRRLRRLAEFVDVGAGTEAAAGADDQQCGDLAIAFGCLDRLDQGAPHCGCERIDRRVVDRGHQHLAVAFDEYDGHVVSLRL